MLHAWAALAAGIVAVFLATGQPAPVIARAAAIPSDFDGDGYADLAIGVSGESVGLKTDAGAVNVIYGSGAGLTAAGDQYWTQDSPGVKGASHESDAFGAALASGDFNSDGFADLAIGAPFDHAADAPDGAVHVLHGSETGLTATGDQRWTPVKLPGVPKAWDGFGAAVASADFDADGFWDLAIGWPEARADGLDRSGAVVILRGSPVGLTATSKVVLTRSMTGAVDPGDYQLFGDALAVGDLDADGFADLAVGAPSDEDPGSVGVFYGTAGGLGTTDSQLWSQDSPGIDGDPLDWEDFGRSLAIGDLDADGIDDLAIGAPGDARTCDVEEECARFGAVHVLFGSPGGVTSTGSQYLHKDVPGMPGVPASHDWFGTAVAAGDFDGDGRDELAIGNPVERRPDVGRVGSVTVLHGGIDGLDTAGAQYWTQASRGVPGTPERGDWFGDALAAADFNGDGRGDLAIGVSGENIGRRGDAGMVDVLYGSISGLSGLGAQGWSQDTPGIRGAAEWWDMFGRDLGQ